MVRNHHLLFFESGKMFLQKTFPVDDWDVGLFSVHILRCSEVA